MKKVWIKAEPWDKRLVTEAIEAGADAVLVGEGKSQQVKELGIIRTVAPDGDIQLGRDVVQIQVTQANADELIDLARRAPAVIISSADWTIIPLENLIAAGGEVIAEVKTAQEAETAVTTLEAGADGVLLATDDPAEVRRTVEALKSRAEKLALQKAAITEVQPIGMGDRVCVDTCSNMTIGEGMLVGTSSAAMFLVHSESIENPYVEPRPFRVNAGAVHAYIQMPGGTTKYLSEIKSGDDALIVNHGGETRTTVVGRAKIERRPLLLVEAEVEGDRVSTILQNAETIRLVSPDGRPVSVVELETGTEVLVMLGTAGRHFGMQVEETIDER